MANRAVASGGPIAYSSFIDTTDGTTAGTLQIPTPQDSGVIQSDIWQGPFYDTANGDAVFVRSQFIGSGTYTMAVWFTDGTAAGTTHQTIKITPWTAAIRPTDSPYRVAVIGNKVVVVGNGTNGNGQPATVQFGVTDGTAAGTTTFTVPGPPAPYSFSTSSLVSTGTKAFFMGTDNNDLDGLWVTDGTAAGTGLITVKGSAISGIGLDPTALTALNGKVYFFGDDAAGYQGLWVSDGTTVGTTEIFAGGVNGGYFAGPSQTPMTVIGNRLFFGAYDSHGIGGLWESDGTTAGTAPVAITNASIETPTLLTSFGTTLLLSDVDASGATGLFAVNAATLASTEISATLGSAVDFTPFGNKALFAATNAAGKVGIWITDGTAAGTTEIVPANAYSQGVMYGTTVDGIADLGNGKAVFYGTNALGTTSLWVTDGTAAGTQPVASTSTFPAVDFASLTPAAAVTIPSAGAVTGVLAANATLVAGNATSVAVSDTSANVANALDALEALAKAGKLDSIALTAGGSSVLNLTPAQLAADGDALAKIAGKFGKFISVPANTNAAFSVGAGASTVVAATGNDTITTGLDGAIVFLGSGASSVALQGTDTVVGGTGAATVSAAASNALVFALGGGLSFVAGSGASSVVAGAVHASITGGAGSTLLFTDGATTYQGGGGTDTLVGLYGTLSVQGGAGGGLFFGGTAGGNVIQAGSGNVTAFAGGNGDLLQANGAASDLFAGGVGIATLTGAGSTGANTFFAGSGNQTLIGGAGNTALVAGQGNDLLVAGSGVTLLLFVNGQTGGADTISGFDATHDFVKLAGYTGSTASLLAAATVSGGATILSLSDGTTITFAGVTNLQTSSFT